MVNTAWLNWAIRFRHFGWYLFGCMFWGIRVCEITNQCLNHRFGQISVWTKVFGCNAKTKTKSRPLHFMHFIHFIQTKITARNLVDECSFQAIPNPWVTWYRSNFLSVWDTETHICLKTTSTLRFAIKYVNNNIRWRRMQLTCIKYLTLIGSQNLWCVTYSVNSEEYEEAVEELEACHTLNAPGSYSLCSYWAILAHHALTKFDRYAMRILKQNWIPSCNYTEFKIGLNGLKHAFVHAFQPKHCKQNNQTN